MIKGLSLKVFSSAAFSDEKKVLSPLNMSLSDLASRGVRGAAGGSAPWKVSRSDPVTMRKAKGVKTQTKIKKEPDFSGSSPCLSYLGVNLGFRSVARC
ncbi:hypothetical protein [Paenibacillus sp. FSL H7-0326]|uniref:hypothetical protein n=1 Tax=Paenibacillus sp. FSL H7-0326 TaxID=1921144 RepID=UPI00117EB8B0|nr:hypothetical protein [Paenibacillus sp. FSL H7-0326]